MQLNKYPVDATGRQIEIGHIVAYPLRQGSSLYQNFGIVRDITYDGNAIQENGVTYLQPILHMDRNVEETVYEHKHGKVIGWKRYSRLKRVKTKNHHLAVIVPMTEKWYMHRFKIDTVVAEYKKEG